MTNLKQTADFNGKTIYVGIDVHLKNWDVSLYMEQQYIRSFHQEAKAPQLINTLKRDYPNAVFCCAYEAGFSGYSLQRQLKAAGMDCLVVNAADIPRTDKERRTKTDRVDSRRIAESLQAKKLRSIYIPTPVSESHRRLIRYRQQLVRDLQRNKARIKHFFHQQGIELPEQFSNGVWSNKFITWLKTVELKNKLDRHTLSKMVSQIEMQRQEIKLLLDEIKELIESKPYRNTATLLLGIPGIGPLTAATLLVEIADIKRFSNFDQLNSFIGFYPGEHSSGESEQKGRMISRHHKTLRSLLIEAAWVAIRKDPALTLAYSELKKRMSGKRAITRIARKLLNRIYHVWTKNDSYENGIVK